MEDKKDPPIIGQDYIGGIRVVDIGDYRVARGMSRRASSSCYHHAMVYDQSERRIWCKDCEHDVEPFDAFCLIVGHFHTQTQALGIREEKVRAAEEMSLISRAAKAVDKIWRGKHYVPTCTQCGHGLLPEDFADGIKSFVGKEYAKAKRKKP